MASHKWVLCLQGAGLDCHRLYEAAGLGCGVVVEELPMLRELLAKKAAAGAAAAGAGGAHRGAERAAGEHDNDEGEDTEANFGGTRIRFSKALPVAAVFVPDARALLSSDTALRAAARDGWRLGDGAELLAQWDRTEAARAALRASASGGGDDLLLLPSMLSSEHWMKRIRSSVSWKQES